MTDTKDISKTTKSKISSVDEYGFERGSSFNYAAYEEFISDYLVVLARRARKWSMLLGNRDAISRRKALKRYIRKGIPMKHRGKIWMSVSGADAKLRTHPAYYEKLLKIEKSQEFSEVIQVDLPRTFPDNIHFKGVDSPKIASLSNILIAFGHHNPQIGYCQGLNYIAGLLLLVVGSEEKAFWLLAVLIEDMLPGYHTQDMVGVLTDIETLGNLIREKKPLIWEHLKYNKVDLNLVTTKWFICLFVEVLPVETVLRIWDCFFYEGNKVLMRVALSLILMNEQELFMSQDFSSLIECFKKMPSDVRILQCHSFIETIFKLTGPMPRSHLVQVRKKSKEAVLKQRKEFEDKRTKTKSSTTEATTAESNIKTPTKSIAAQESPTPTPSKIKMTPATKTEANSSSSKSSVTLIGTSSKTEVASLASKTSAASITTTSSKALVSSPASKISGASPTTSSKIEVTSSASKTSATAITNISSEAEVTSLVSKTSAITTVSSKATLSLSGAPPTTSSKIATRTTTSTPSKTLTSIAETDNKQQKGNKA